MTTNSKNYSSMVDRILLILDKFKTIWTAKPKMVSRLDHINAIQTDITTLAKKQGLSTSGATDTKNTDRDIASVQCFHVENILKSYYLDKKDQTNFDLVSYPITNFSSGGIKESIKNMNFIYDTAAAILLKTPTALDEFNLEATDMAELRSDIDTLSVVVPVTSTMRSTNKAITKELNAKFGELRAEVSELDVNINTFTKKQPEFSDTYFAGRRIVHSGVGHKTAEVALMPEQYEFVLGDKYKIGNVLTIKNRSEFALEYGLSHDPKVTPTNMNTLAGVSETKLTVELDDTGSFGHWLVLHNPHDMDDVNVTVFIAKG